MFGNISALKLIVVEFTTPVTYAWLKVLVLTTIVPIFGVGAEAGIVVQPTANGSINWFTPGPADVPVNKGTE